MRWLHALRARARLLAREASESRMRDEIEFHIVMEAERLTREEGLSPADARRRALVTFGGIERHAEALREGRGAAWLGGLSLDFKLALRMLLKHPALTVVATLGLSVAVAIGAVAFALIYTLLDPPSVPLHEGDRVVAIHNMDVRRSNEARRTHLHDLSVWREALTTVSELGAFRTVDRNLITLERPPEPVRIAEMTASGFRIARVPPLVGRYFDDADERPGAPPVVVIGHGVWQSRFAGDPRVIGRSLRLGATEHTVIGVMPPGFAFPINNRVWTPLRLDAASYERGQAPPIEVFGRLAPGASIDDAHTQLATIARRLASESPATHEHIQPRVLPYARAFIESPEMSWLSHLFQLLVTMLLVVIGTNVALLVYARTASRTGELALRSALGASRGRIVGQLFAEALVLSSIGAAVGLLIAWLGLRQLDAYVARTSAETFPFWMQFGISRGMVLYVAGLAVLGAVIVGAVPALKATRRGLHATLQLGAGGTAMRLGKVWTGLIVGQVAIAVAILPLALAGVLLLARQAATPPAVPAGQWIIATLDRDVERPGEPDADEVARTRAMLDELLRRLRDEPGARDVVLASSMPGEEPTQRIEVDGAPSEGATDHVVQLGSIDAQWLDAFDVALLAGRPLTTADAATGLHDAGAVVVNRSFVAKVLGGADPLGRRVRPVVRTTVDDHDPAPSHPWMEIVGVVEDFPNRVNPRFPEPRIYRALGPNESTPVTLAVRGRVGAPDELARRLREIVVALDPMLRVHGVASLDDQMRDRLLENRLLVGVVLSVTVSVLLLAAAGIYALIAFTVARRRREIGIRAALGATPRGILAGVLSKAARQIATGIVLGSIVAAVLDRQLNGGFTGGRGASLLVVVGVIVALVGMLAAMGPARRALAIQPTEALKGE